jgi:cell wall-associated NlpC family hydrolase
MGQMHAGFVGALGLAPDAGAVQRALVRAGLHPRPNAGTEVVTRMLGLTFNHPDDRTERFTSDPATRAEASWSAAQAMAAVPLGVPLIHQKLIDLVTALDAAPRPPPPWIGRAVSFIGYPYVWGGQWATRVGPDRTQVHGGFDCSGLVWRVAHLVPGGLTSRQLGGRTTYSMAAATPPSRRLTPAQLRPGDQILFGDARGPRSPVSAIDHTALSLGGSWFIQSSTQGVTIEQLSGSYLADFAFARRLPVRGWQPRPWTPPPPRPAPAQLSTASFVAAAAPGGPLGIHVAWTGTSAPRVSTTLLAAPITGAAWAPVTLAAHLPVGADTTIPIPPELGGQAFDVELVTLRDGQTLGESTAPVAPPPSG